jgi:hypothetical protein
MRRGDLDFFEVILLIEQVEELVERDVRFFMIGRGEGEDSLPMEVESAE